MKKELSAGTNDEQRTTADNSTSASVASKHNVICSLKRLNVFDKQGKLIGQDYQRDNGDWMHKWFDSKTKAFERGSWRGRCDDAGIEEWLYQDCTQRSTH